MRGCGGLAGYAAYVQAFDHSSLDEFGFPCLRSSMIILGAILQVWQILDHLVMALSHPNLLRPRIEFIALRHLDVVIEAADLEAFKTLLVDTILAKLGSASEAFQVGIAELIDAVGKCMSATRRHYAKRVRVLVTSWRAVGAESPDKDKHLADKQNVETAEFAYEQEEKSEKEQVEEDLKARGRKLP